MRSRLLAVAVVLSLAACQKAEAPVAPATTATAPAAATVAAPVAADTAAPVSTPLPENLVADFAYRVRSRGTEGDVHKLMIEFQGTDAVTVDQKVEALLVAKGYRRYKTLQNGDGMVGDYGHDGRRVTVTTTPANGALSLAADSRGTVYFVWSP